MLAGNLVALFFSALLCITLTYIRPADFDWAELRNIPTIEKVKDGADLSEDDQEMLNNVLMWTYRTGGVLTLVLIIMWPCLALPAQVFSKGYFTFWIVLAIIWGLLASIACILLPLFEARESIKTMARIVFCCQPLPKAREVGQDADEDVPDKVMVAMSAPEAVNADAAPAAVAPNRT